MRRAGKRKGGEGNRGKRKGARRARDSSYISIRDTGYVLTGVFRMWNAISNSAWRHSASARARGVDAASRRDTWEKEGASQWESFYIPRPPRDNVSDFSYEQPKAFSMLYTTVCDHRVAS